MSRFARLLFTWMIAHADDWGVMVGEPRRVRALVLPMDDDATDAEVAAALDEMAAQELIWRYQDPRGVALIQFRTWEEHQHGLHKRTAPKLPRYSDISAEAETNFREIPGTSRNFLLNGTERKETEQNGSTPTAASAASADAAESPADDSAPTARSSEPSSPSTASAPAPQEAPQQAPQQARPPLFPLPDRLPSETTERAYWERVMKDMPGKHRVPALVELARSKISLDAPPGSDAYGRIGALAKKHTASLVAVWIIQAAGQHIAGDPLDYLTKLAGRQLEREAQTNGRHATYGRRPGAHGARDRAPEVGSPEYYAQALANQRR